MRLMLIIAAEAIITILTRGLPRTGTLLFIENTHQHLVGRFLTVNGSKFLHQPMHELTNRSEMILYLFAIDVVDILARGPFQVGRELCSIVCLIFLAEHALHPLQNLHQEL